MTDLRQIKRNIRAIGGSLEYHGRSREFPPSGRPYWRRLYKLSLPGQPDQVMDRLSIDIKYGNQ